MPLYAKERTRNKFGTPLRWRRIYVRIQGVDTAHSWLRNYVYIAEDEHKDKRVVEVCRARSRF